MLEASDQVARLQGIAQQGVDASGSTKKSFGRVQAPENFRGAAGTRDRLDRRVQARVQLSECPDRCGRSISVAARRIDGAGAAGVRPELAGTIFVPAPALDLSAAKTARLTQLLRKFDPVERDHRNRALGRAGEEFVLDVERSRLRQAGLSRLARNIRWVANDEGDGAGYDILSFDLSGRERPIEVKTTNGIATTPFFLSRNEIATAAARMDTWRLYRVREFAKAPRIFEMSPPLDDKVVLRPIRGALLFGHSDTFKWADGLGA